MIENIWNLIKKNLSKPSITQDKLGLKYLRLFLMKKNSMKEEHNIELYKIASEPLKIRIM